MSLLILPLVSSPCLVLFAFLIFLSSSPPLVVFALSERASITIGLSSHWVPPIRTHLHSITHFRVRLGLFMFSHPCVCLKSLTRHWSEPPWPAALQNSILFLSLLYHYPAIRLYSCHFPSSISIHVAKQYEIYEIYLLSIYSFSLARGTNRTKCSSSRSCSLSPPMCMFVLFVLDWVALLLYLFMNLVELFLESIGYIVSTFLDDHLPFYCPLCIALSPHTCILHLCLSLSVSVTSHHFSVRTNPNPWLMVRLPTVPSAHPNRHVSSYMPKAILLLHRTRLLHPFFFLQIHNPNPYCRQIFTYLLNACFAYQSRHSVATS